MHIYCSPCFFRGLRVSVLKWGRDATETFRIFKLLALSALNEPAYRLKPQRTSSKFCSRRTNKSKIKPINPISTMPATTRS